MDADGFTVVTSKGRPNGDKAKKKTSVVSRDLSAAETCAAAKDIVARVTRMRAVFEQGSQFAEQCWQVLGPVVGEEKKWRVRCRGVGCVGRSEAAQLQCAFALFLHSRAGSDSGTRPDFVEPMLGSEECEALRELGFDMLTHDDVRRDANEKGEEKDGEKELLYCPHAPAGLYHNEMLWRWSASRLRNTVIVGNSFSNYLCRLPSGRAPLIAKVESFVSESMLPNNPDASTVFNDTAVHSFGAVSVAGFELPVLSEQDKLHNDPEML